MLAPSTLGKGISGRGQDTLARCPNGLRFPHDLVNGNVRKAGGEKLEICHPCESTKKLPHRRDLPNPCA